MANLRTYALFELKLIHLRNGRYFFYRVLDKPTSKSVTLVRFVATDVYLDKI